MIRVENKKKQLLSIGRYKVIRTICTSNQKDIYHVKDTKPPYKNFVIRVLKLDQCPKQIDTEIEILHILNQYDDLLKFYDVQLFGNKIVLFFDYIKGYTISQILKKAPKYYYNIKRIKFFLLNMIYILEVYRRNHIVHRNITLDNIIFDGKRYHLVGLSKAYITLNLNNNEHQYDIDIYDTARVVYFLLFKKEYHQDTHIPYIKNIDNQFIDILKGMLQTSFDKQIKLNQIFDYFVLK
jgi:tRNA A-37 threonylcarbamoyl transferase component Bud32